MTTTAVPAPRNFKSAWALLPQPRADNVLRDTAARIAREFHYALDPADLGQEFMVFLVEKPGWVAKWFYEKDGAINFGWMSFKRDAASIMARAARAARAAAGYGEDDTFYSPKQLEALLPFVFHSLVLATVGGEREEISAPTDAAKGGGHMAQVMDIRIAYEAVIREGSAWDEVLRALYHTGLSQTEASVVLNLSPAVISSTRRKSFDAILTAVNGTVPLKVDHEGPGARRATSNASAIARTRGQE